MRTDLITKIDYLIFCRSVYYKVGHCSSHRYKLIIYRFTSINCFYEDIHFVEFIKIDKYNFSQRDHYYFVLNMKNIIIIIIFTHQ